jgi:oxygen-dependent protoporphyrinogen oxidase
VLQFGDDRTFGDWLGSLPGDADALFRATVTRSTAELDEVSFGHGAGYFALVWSSSGGLSRNIIGGAGRLIEEMAAGLSGRIVTGAFVSEVTEQDGEVHVRYASGDEEHVVVARHAVVATKAFDAARIVTGLPGDTRSALESIPYGPTVVMGMLTRETGSMPWDDLYALATPKRDFSMLFNIANVLRPRSPERQPGGSLMVYRSAHAALELMELPDAEVEKRFLDSLYAIYPEARGIVAETVLLKLPRMLPYVAPGRAALQPALERPLGRVRLAGDYLGGFYTDTSVSTGQEAATAIRAALAADHEHALATRAPA